MGTDGHTCYKIRVIVIFLPAYAVSCLKRLNMPFMLLNYNKLSSCDGVLVVFFF